MLVHVVINVGQGIGRHVCMAWDVPYITDFIACSCDVYTLVLIMNSVCAKRLDQVMVFAPDV